MLLVGATGAFLPQLQGAAVVQRRSHPIMADDSPPPTPVEITEAQRANLGCPEYTDEMAETWKSSVPVFDGETLKIQGHPVMEAWEHPYMARLAEIAASRGGKVFELGFGMAISATYMESHPIDEHWICEANAEVAKRAAEWAKTDAKSKVVIKEGFSWDVSPSIPDETFSGILYDTYPIQAGKVNLHQRDFFDEAARLLKPGGIFTYFCNEDTAISDEEIGLLEAVGFDVSYEVVDVPTPDDCQYWRAKTIIAPLCVKRA